MPRPQSKSALLELSNRNYKSLLDLVASCSVDDLHKEFPEGYLNRNIRDVLAHLHHWHLMMLEWYQVGMAGEKPAIPAKGYTWKTVPELNRKIQEKYHAVDLQEVMRKLEDSHHEVQKLIEKHSDEELFEKQRYKWTGSTSLGAYFISATSSHYDWAYKLIKKCMKGGSR